MSDRSVVTSEQRGGSPFGREMDAERRTGRRQHGPFDPEATPSDDDQTIVERGRRIRDAAAGERSMTTANSDVLATRSTRILLVQ